MVDGAIANLAKIEHGLLTPNSPSPCNILIKTMSNGNFMSNIPKRRKKTFRIMKQCFGWRELERHLNRLQKARYCSYLKQQQTLNGIGKTCEVFSLCIHCCFNSHFHCTFPSLIFAGFNLLKLQNNREEETLSPFNCGKKRKITKIPLREKKNPTNVSPFYWFDVSGCFFCVLLKALLQFYL